MSLQAFYQLPAGLELVHIRCRHRPEVCGWLHVRRPGDPLCLCGISLRRDWYYERATEPEPPYCVGCAARLEAGQA